MPVAMHRHTLSDPAEMASGRSSRAPSFSSDRPSVASSVTFQMPASVRPAPAYIAAAVASQTVTDHHNAQLRQEDPDNEELQNAIFSEQALALLNAFLDHLLFAFLSSARSPSLTAVRPAISDVLKPRLAREAMEAADVELQGLLAGEDDEEFPAQSPSASERWDVEKIWKRTRLRIMVYTRLGELEDEDEERYVAQERGLSMDDDDDDEAGLVSWASAIFLTSVIEYVAEQSLLISGSAAFARMAAKVKKQAEQSEDPSQLAFERLIIEEPDAEKIALNSALGRLWRTWRKRVRSPISPLSPGRGVRPVSSYSSFHNRRISHDTIDEFQAAESASLPDHTPTETDIAANIPLPIRENDINEIEVPGLAPTFEDEPEGSGAQIPMPRPRRPTSLIVSLPEEMPWRRTHKIRPLSMPGRPMPLFSTPLKTPIEEPETETPFQTSMERQPGSDSYFADEEKEPVPPLETVPEHQPPESPEEDAEMVAFAAATGMGFRMSSIGPAPVSSASDALEKTIEGSETPSEAPSPGGYESEPKVMQSKRMSIEKRGPPGVVRTVSMRSGNFKTSQETPDQTPKASARTSYLDDTVSDEEPEQKRAIGVARTSDVPIQSLPASPTDSPTEKGKSPGHGGFVELQPRHVTPTSMPVQSSFIPEPSSARREVEVKSSTNNDNFTTSSQMDAATGSSRKQESPFSKPRTALPALQEVDPVSAKPKDKMTIETPVNRRGSPTISSPTTSSPQRSPTYSNHETMVHRVSTIDFNRSESAHQRTSSDKASVRRVSSTASSTKKKSGSFTMAPTGRESQISQRSRGLSGRMSDEDRAREFESLVKGQETVKFTLTPQNMRDLDENPVQKVENTNLTTTSVVVHPRTSADKDSFFGTGKLPNRSASRSKGPVPSQLKQSPSKKVVTKPLAREPRIETESMQDFADFIRSTGPAPGQEKPIKPFNINGAPGSPSSSAAALARQLFLSKTSAGRANMRPRSPAGLSSGNDDLIDFIRQGPPNANNGQPRIPKNIAPFRSTVDSDQFDTMLKDHENVESVYGSTTSTVDSNMTVNSQTGLLPNSKVVQPAYSNTPQKLSGNTASGSEPQVTKTRRRVKDPYAIDVSDDEDEDQLTALPNSGRPAAQPPKQESLMDFLSAMEPPKENKPQPFRLSDEAIAAARARATASNTSISSSNPTIRNGNTPSASSAYGPTSSSWVSSDAPRAYKPKLQARVPASSEARAGGGGRTATSDLADFLRNSGPPDISASSSVTSKEEKKSSSRRFWKKR